MTRLAALLASALLALPALADGTATGDLGLVIERERGSLVVVDRSDHAALGRIEGLGDLSHASLTYSPDERFAYVFGRDGGLTKVDILDRKVVNRVMQAGNSIGGAISDDGRLIAVSNYEPGGVRVFDADTLEMIADIPTGAKTIGLVEAPGRRFVFTMWETGETWIADLSGKEPQVTKFTGIGKNPFDAVLTPDGRTYLIGLFGEKGLVSIDLWSPEPKPVRFMEDYGKDQEDLPVYKMPHLQGWALADDQFVVPAVGQHELLWVDRRSLTEVARTKTHGQPVFVIAQPASPFVWVNFAHPLNDTVQVVNTVTHEVVKELTPGPAVLHMEFTPRGHEVWISVRDENLVEIYDTRTYEKLGEIAAESPSGIFFTARAHQPGL